MKKVLSWYSTEKTHQVQFSLETGPSKVNQKWPFSGWKFENLENENQFGLETGK